MSLPALHKFKGDLAAKAPRTISAARLDDNFRKVTVLPAKIASGGAPEYQVEYKADGVQLFNLRGLPAGAVAKEFTVCDNGEPRVYWLLTWEQEPTV